MPRTKFFLFLFTSVLLPALQAFPQPAKESYMFKNPTLTIEERVNDLVSHLTLKEKVLQMQNDAPAVDRLGIPAYNWWSECLHGVARNGIATVFPQAIGMAATWDPGLIHREADVISTEARAKYDECVAQGKRGIYQGLTFWSPNINIFRDPRWGRGQETYGEDPFLTGTIGTAFVKGLQGNDPKYLKVVSTAKHFAVHSGPEPDRHSFDAWCSETDLYMTYLPAFEALIRYGKAFSVMGAYNRFWNEPCTASDLLLDRTLRKKWGFEGYVTSDCGAVWDIYNGHKLQPDAVRSSVLTVKAGCDLTCGDEYQYLADAVAKGYISEAEIDVSVKRLFTARFRLGLFDPDSLVPWSRIRASDNNSPQNSSLALKVAEESMVLLKNDRKALPFGKKVRSLAVIGPYADRLSVLLGNYNGTPSDPVTILKGIRDLAGKNVRVEYSMGVAAPEDASMKKEQKEAPDENVALDLAARSDAVVFVGGISPELEGEEMDVKIPGFSGGDRTSLDLPEAQEALLKRISALGKPLVLVLTNGSALSVNWEQENIPAILDAWYPGQQGGRAVAEVLFGLYNPGGRLPVTFYRSVKDLPPFTDYAMRGRTYRYFDGNPLYSFGYGLSFSTFNWVSGARDKDTYAESDTIRLNFMIRNEGPYDGDEVAEVYCRKAGSKYERPLKALCGFLRKTVKAGTTAEFPVAVAVRDLRMYDPAAGDYVIEKGRYQLLAGPDPGHPKFTIEITVL